MNSSFHATNYRNPSEMGKILLRLDAAKVMLWQKSSDKANGFARSRVGVDLFAAALHREGVCDGPGHTRLARSTIRSPP